MEERTVTHERGDAVADGVAGDRPSIVHRYRLSLETALSVSPDGDGWACRPEHRAGGRVGEEDWAPAEEGDGAAQAFVDLLRYEALPPVQGFEVVRLVPPPEATGERAVDREAGRPSTVVVGERVVVTWTGRAADARHPGPATLEHLAALNFLGVPDTYGLLLWRTPGGHRVPVAAASRYLPRSRDGWSWLAEVMVAARTGAVPEQGDEAAELPARVGRLVAKLHLALATPSRVLPEPTATADADAVRTWHARALDVFGIAEAAAAPGADGGWPVRERLAECRSRIEALLDVAQDAGAAGVHVQRIHGDLHIGRVLRWPRGLAVVGFDAQPPDPDADAELQLLSGVEHPTELHPPARDLARLLASLGELVRREGTAGSRAQDEAWSGQVRAQVLGAYRAELAADGRPELLDERLLAAFEAEQYCRDTVQHRVLALDDA
jgi:maltokinase